jgi:hypothetical protein
VIKVLGEPLLPGTQHDVIDVAVRFAEGKLVSAVRLSGKLSGVFTFTLKRGEPR